MDNIQAQEHQQHQPDQHTIENTNTNIENTSENPMLPDVEANLDTTSSNAYTMPEQNDVKRRNTSRSRSRSSHRSSRSRSTINSSRKSRREEGMVSSSSRSRSPYVNKSKAELPPPPQPTLPVEPDYQQERRYAEPDVMKRDRDKRSRSRSKPYGEDYYNGGGRAQYYNQGYGVPRTPPSASKSSHHAAPSSSSYNNSSSHNNGEYYYNSSSAYKSNGSGSNNEDDERER